MGYNDVLLAARRRNYGTVAGVQGAEDDAINQQQGYGTEASDAYLHSATNFDASAALDKYARGAWGSVSAGLDKTLNTLKGQSVGAGRFDSGYFDEDSGQVVRDTMNDFTNNLSAHALDAASLQQRNDEGLANFGNQRTAMGNELLSDRSTQVQNDAREEAERARKKRSGIGSAIGSVLGGAGGAVLGGPWGASIGAQIGGAAGGAW